MTFCIAALSRSANAVFTVSDMMLSGDWTSTETDAMKLNPIGPSNRWVTLFSGSPTARHEVVMERMATCLPDGGEATAKGVQLAFEAAFRDALKAKIEGEILSRLGLDRDGFMRRGRRLLGEDEFSRLLMKVESAKLKTDFLVAGWESSGIFRMFSVRDPGVTEYHDPLGFYAIGSGWVQAYGYLCGTYHRDLAPAELVYHLCVAKFLGESAPGVGRRTIMWALESNGTHWLYPPEQLEELRKIWSKERSNVPAEAKQMADNGLKAKINIKWGTT